MPGRNLGRQRLLVLAAAGLALVGGAPPDSKDSVAKRIRRCDDLRRYEAFRPAMAELEAACRDAEALGDRRLIGLCLDRLGLLHDSMGDYETGAPLHERALQIAAESGDSILQAAVFASLTQSRFRRGEYETALDFGRRALALQEAAGDAEGAARTLLFLGRVRYKQGLHTEALALTRRSLANAEARGDRRDQSLALEDIADVLQEKGEYAAALESYQAALARLEELGDTAGISYALHLVGRCYMLQGAYRSALGPLRRGLDVAESSGDPAGRALALYHLGLVYYRQGAYARARECYETAVKLKLDLGDRRQAAWIRYRIGHTRREEGDLEGAAASYRFAIAEWEAVRDPRGLAAGLESLAGIYERLGDEQAAIASLERARELRETTQPTYLASVLAGLGELYAKMGDSDRALRFGRQATEAAARHESAEARASAAHRLGRIQWSLGMRSDAVASLRESLAIVETLRSRVVPSEETRAGYLESRQQVYADTIAILTELGRGAEAFEVAERSRARAFLDLMGGRDLEAKPAGADTLERIRAREEELRRERPSGKARPTVGGAVDRGAPGGPGAGTEVGPNLRLGSASAATVEEARGAARGRGVTLVEYFSAEGRLFIWVVSPDGRIRAATSAAGRGELSALVSDMRRNLRAGGSDRADPTDPEPEEAEVDRGTGDVVAPAGDPGPTLKRLHRLLVEPIESFLPRDPDRTVVIVPHGPLFLVSFAGLPDGNGRYFVERHTLAYGPSVGVFRYTARSRERQVDRDRPKLLLVGNPTMPSPPGGSRPLKALPGAEAETVAIESLFPSDRVTALTGGRASERTVRELAPGETIIHLATHAVVFDEEPWSSFLALAPDAYSAGSETDGLLTVREVFSLDLHSGLVTLSACNTGLGRVTGDGVIGLSRAFLYAGTPSVMVSLWRVADPVARFQMERFYGHLGRGAGKAASLRRAQLETLEALRRQELRSPSGRPLSESPLLWAPFVLVGEPD